MADVAEVASLLKLKIQPDSINQKTVNLLLALCQWRRTYVTNLTIV